MAVRSGMFGRDWWKENLRMSEDTFLILCNKLRPCIEKQVLNFYVEKYHIISLPIIVIVRLLTFEYPFLLRKEWQLQSGSWQPMLIQDIVGSFWSWKVDSW